MDKWVYVGIGALLAGGLIWYVKKHKKHHKNLPLTAPTVSPAASTAPAAVSSPASSSFDPWGSEAAVAAEMIKTAGAGVIAKATS